MALIFKMLQLFFFTAVLSDPGHTYSTSPSLSSLPPYLVALS